MIRPEIPAESTRGSVFDRRPDLHDWKLGDVALVEAGCWANRKVALRLDEGWSHVNGVNVDGDGVVSPVRPLVVIDPEDLAQVERLIAAFWANGTGEDDTLAMQAALREFDNPPKPDEPTGLGAVVEDARGKRWVRCSDTERAEDCWRRRYAAAGGWHRYADIAAVRVLFEGVTE